MGQNIDVKILYSIYPEELQQEISKCLNDGYALHGSLVVDNGCIYVMMINFGTAYMNTTCDEYDVELFTKDSVVVY